MKKLIALFAALAVVGCGGTESTPAGVIDDPGVPTGGPTGTVTLPIDTAGASEVKLIIKRNALVPVPQQEDEEGNIIPAHNELREVFRYNTNVTAPATSVSIPAGDNYTMDVIARNTTNVTGFWTTSTTDHAEGFSVTNGGTFNPVLVPGVLPSITLPTSIYAGLGAPYHQYVATAQNVGGFWARTWTAARTAPSDVAIAGTVSGMQATFASPPAGTTASMTHAATFKLLPALLLSTDDPADWDFVATASQAPVPTGTIVVGGEEPAPAP